jgi:hypothetical protein
MFRLRGEVIKPRQQEKAAAEEIYREAIDEGRGAILSRDLGDGLVEFQLGNLPPNDFCDVEVLDAFVSNSVGSDKLFFKFRLDTCTQSGSTQCVTSLVTGDFLFTLRNADPSSVSAISTNVTSTFDSASCIYSITSRVTVPAILVTTTEWSFSEGSLLQWQYARRHSLYFRPPRFRHSE